MGSVHLPNPGLKIEAKSAHNMSFMISSHVAIYEEVDKTHSRLGVLRLCYNMVQHVKVGCLECLNVF